MARQRRPEPPRGAVPRDGPSIEIRPRRAGVGSAGGAGAAPVAGVYRAILHYARQSRVQPGARRAATRLSLTPLQRCAVRVTYASNRIAGQWRAHGRYVARESAGLQSSGDFPHRGPGYDASGAGHDLAQRLAQWQGAGDPRLFKLILSPEFGDRLDLPSLTRAVMQQLEQRLGTSLQWLAVDHFNTEHPHTHVALRGVAADGRAVLLPRELVREGLRQFAQEAATAQLGYRTERDRDLAEQREQTLTRVTLHDRRLRSVAQVRVDGWLAVQPHRAALAALAREGLRGRLQHLSALQLAQSDGRGAWRVRPDFEAALGALAAAADRQRALARVDAAISDLTLPRQATAWAQLARAEGGGRLAGRVLGQGEGEGGSGYFLLEGVDGRVHYLLHVGDTEYAHARGALRSGDFVTLHASAPEGTLAIAVQSHGEAQAWLRDPGAVARWAQAYRADGGALAPGTDQGWLGDLQRLLTTARTPARATPDRGGGRDGGRGGGGRGR